MMEKIAALLTTIKILRSENGCSWDRKQTHESLIPYLSEESGEVIEAILTQKPEPLEEELGDLLLQILLHAQIASEKGYFDFHDIADTLNQKMIRRHPHVFSGKTYLDEAEQKADWNAIKVSEKSSEESAGLLESVTLSLSGLNNAYQLQKKAASVGFDWDNLKDVQAKIEEEYAELQQELTIKSRKEKIEEEFGDLLFAMVNLARHLDLDPERAIARTNLKFKNRFHYVEKHLNKACQEATLAEMDYYWNQAKEREH